MRWFRPAIAAPSPIRTGLSTSACSVCTTSSPPRPAAEDVWIYRRVRHAGRRRHDAAVPDGVRDDVGRAAGFDVLADALVTGHRLAAQQARRREQLQSVADREDPFAGALELLKDR